MQRFFKDLAAGNPDIAIVITKNQNELFIHYTPMNIGQFVYMSTCLQNEIHEMMAGRKAFGVM